MALRCAVVSVDCAVLIAAISAAYADDAAAAGGATVNCVGLVRRIMRHPPAFGSRLDGCNGGSSSKGETALSHEEAMTSAAAVPIKTHPRPGRLEMEGIHEPGGEGRGLTDVASVEDV